MRSAIQAILVFSLLCGFFGCSKQSDDELPTHAEALSALYAQFRMQHRGGLPKDEAELRAYIESQAQLLKDFRIESVNDLLLSDSDGQPFVLLFGNKVHQTRDGRQVVGHEQLRADGLRTLIFATGETEELDEAAFTTLMKKR